MIQSFFLTQSQNSSRSFLFLSLCTRNDFHLFLFCSEILRCKSKKRDVLGQMQSTPPPQSLFETNFFVTFLWWLSCCLLSVQLQIIFFVSTVHFYTCSIFNDVIAGWQSNEGVARKNKVGCTASVKHRRKKNNCWNVFLFYLYAYSPLLFLLYACSR